MRHSKAFYAMHLMGAVALASFGLANSASVSEQWASFKDAYGKTYHADEEQQRIDIFRRNLEFMAVENRKNQGFTLGITQFADLTNEEFATLQGSTQRPASSIETDGYYGIHEFSGMQLPDSLDWVQKGAVTGVKNQLHCGACWAFSAIGAMESHTQINMGKTVHLSEQQLVDCDTNVVPNYENRGCQGGWPSNAFMYAVNHSICTEDSYGYAGKSQSCRASSCEEGLPAQTVLGFKNVQPDSEQALIEALQLGPVSVELNGNSIAFQFYHGGIINGPLCGPATNHGVLVVGYGPDHFKIKNSWGSGWGEGGYVRLGRGKGGHGECGFLTAPNYPVFANTSLIV